VTQKDRPILLFDGVCRLCCGHVAFVARRDPRGRVRFAALQSPPGEALLAARGIPAPDFTSVLVLDGDEVLVKSAAVLRVLAELSFPWPLFGRLVGVLPRTLRDAAYDLVARNRYRLFGRRETCLVPTPDLLSRFLD
jgi:predicted DCC family thiol-disulfide oxidoreductase YuxK